MHEYRASRKRHPRGDHTAKLKHEALKAFFTGRGVEWTPASLMEYLDVSQPTASRICNLEWDEWVSITVVSAIAKRIPDDVPLQRFFDYGKRTEQAAA